MNSEMYLMLLYLLTLDNNLTDEEKESLKSMHKGWRFEYGNYNPRISPKETKDVIRVAKTLIREPCENNRENALLVKIIEYLLEETCWG